MAKNTIADRDGSTTWRKVITSVIKSHTTVDLVDLTNLKREIEIIPDCEHVEFVSVFIPWTFIALSSLPPANEATFSVRECILDIYTMLPSFNEAIKPHLNDIMSALIKILAEDFEANGLTAMHLFMEFHKMFRGAVETSVQPFIDMVLGLLEKFPEISADLLRDGAAIETRLIPASRSIKIIIESPVMVVLLFQLHRRFINDNILKFVPFIIKILEISIPAPKFEAESKASDDLSLVSGQIRCRSRQNYCDFIQAKVKVLSFLAYVSRSFSSALKSFQNSIPMFVIDILNNCPPESASARKELLVAVRHILATDLRQAFVSQFETLLDDDLLFGIGYTSSNVMRPLVFSTMADLVHHIRLDLSSGMIIRVIDIYARCFHDPSLPYGIQTMSAKLLLNLMDCVNSEKVETDLRRPLSMKILSILLRKYARLAKVVEEINKKRFDPSGKNEKTFDAYWDDPLKSRIICSDSISADSGKDNIRDIKFVLKTVTAGIKSIILSFKTNYISFNPENDAPVHPANAFSNSCNFTLEESRLFIDMFRHGVACFDICQSETALSSLNGNNGTSTSVTSISAEDKELVDQFAYIFTLLDPYIFQDVLSAHLDFLFEKIVKNPVLLIIPQYFLAINTVSRNFAGILIKFLMDKFEIIGENSPQSSAILRLFKLVFLAVSVYPDENEQMILPYISDIILNCLRLSQKSSHPVNYFLILKALFRGIAGGRFEHLYKEVLPILPLLLESLNKLVTSSTDRQMQDLYVELCLTTPVRLSVLLPYLPFLMKPLVLSLTSESELVNQGLRTLELCVDNLTQDFLEPILAPVLPELLNALWSLLRSGPSNQSQAQFALRILGKFGGRGRRFLKYPLKLEYVESKSSGISLVFDPLPESDRLLELPFDILIDLCHDYFCVPTAKPFEVLQEAQLFSLLCSSLSSICGFDVLKGTKLDTELLSIAPFAQDIDPKLTYDEQSVLNRLKNQTLPEGICPNTSEVSSNFKKLLTALFHLSSRSYSEFSSKAIVILENIGDHFVFIQILAQRNQAKDYSFTGLTPNLFLEVLVEKICGPIEKHTEFALELLSRLHSRLIASIPADKISELPLFFLLVEKLIAYCYGSDFAPKIGACHGLKLLCEFNLGSRWMWMQESRIVRGLLFILKDVPAYASDLQTRLVSETLLTFLRLCHSAKDLNDAELKSKNQYYFNQIMSILISELTNSNTNVRDVVHSSFELLSECNGCEVGELLAPHRDRLLLPIFTKPLRALPFSLQIGYVDAVNYCLNLKPPLVSFSEELLRLLHEALALVEADDTALVSKSGQLKNAQNLINLRVVCISLLSTAISCSEFQDPKMHQIRNHIVSAFFKSLYSRAPEIVAVARKGLELVILHQQKLPKDLLQHGLRPVLINLADAKRLTLSGLEGLSKVLQLLTSYFKAEIGKKLLDHVSIWADQKLLEELSGKPLLESMEIKIIVAILDVFHLLPPSANLFLEEMVLTVQKLDTWTKRTRSSPFRPALFKFMYKHQTDAVAYLLNHPENSFFAELFASSLNSEDAAGLVNELNKSENMKIFLDRYLLNRIKLERLTRISSFNILIPMIAKLKNEFSCYPMIKEVLAAFISGSAPLDTNKEIISGSDEECDLVLDFAFAYLYSTPLDMDTLLSMLAALESSASCLDITWIPRDIRMICQATPTKKDILMSCIDVINSPGSSVSFRARIIRLIILPVIASIKEQGNSLVKVVGAQFLQKVEKCILSRDCSTIQSISSILSLEELQLVCLILSFDSASTEIKNISLSMRRFIVNRNASPDPVVRYSALFTACYYISEMGLDVKYLDSIIKSSLNIPTSEVRPLLRQCLSYTLPCLFKNASPAFLKSWLPEILSDLSKNSHFLTVIAVFWSNFIQLEQDISVHREILIRPLISCLSKAAISVFSVQEHRSYPFNIARMILNWLEQDQLFNIEDSYIEQFIHTLIKSVLIFTDNGSEPRQFVTEGLGFLHRISKLLHDQMRPYKLRYDIFSRSLPPQAEVSEEAITTSCLLVKIILTISENRDDSQLIVDFENLQRFLHFCLTSCNDKLVTEICPLLTRICRIKSEKFDELLTALQHFLLESLQTSRALYSTVMILNTLRSSNAIITDNIIASFLRTFQKICTEHITRIDQSGDSTMDENSSSTFAKSFLIPPMKFAVSAFCIPSSSSKYVVFNALRLLWENTSSPEVLLFIIENIQSWFNEEGEILDFKEKSDIISTPSKLFELQDENLMDKYLELILTIYSSPRLRTTDLTMKLEGSFLYGLCYSKIEIRNRFFKLIDELIPRKVEDRIIFVFSSQRWNLVANCYWISFAVEFILAAWPRDLQSVSCLSWPRFADTSFEACLLYRNGLEDFFNVLNDVLRNSDDACHDMWLQIFPQIWESLSPVAREELSECICKVLADPDFEASSLSRPNSMKTILDGLALLPKFPDISNNLVSYIGSEFGAWHSACVILENNLAAIKKIPKSHDYAPIKDLCQLYERLGETEMSSGLIRRFSIFPETNIALSFEQNNYWMAAQKVFEKAQIKARNGTIPFFEDEFIVWETHWENCAKKLQQWDLLSEIAKVDNNTNLSLECEWVLNDWSRTETKTHIETLLGQVKESTQKKKLMESFILLNQLKDVPEKLTNFQSSMESLVQEMMMSWSQLPEFPSAAHCSALEQLQIIVEVQESQSFFTNALNSMNRPQFLQELKALLSTWRDRLPNNWEDTGVWSNLLAWRQHVFTAINSVFHNSTTLNPADTTGSVNPQSSHPFAYRGYHETAWLINRFAHVARKNGMFDVSLSFLNKIYTLPNIEIQDAFLKLREQAKCYMENPNELPTALEVINATNLNYFNNTQKAEFFTLKAIVLSRLGMIDEANRIFAQAVQIDLNIAKGWSSWGYFNDQRFQQSKDITFGVNAVNCYLQAATLCKNVNSRKYLTRVLWLLTFEDTAGSMSKSFELYNHDLPSWYWVPFISELLTSLNRREARQARFLLMKIAKSYPQALYLQLRTINEEYKLSSLSPAGSSTPVQGESSETKFSTSSPNPSAVSDSNNLQNLTDKASLSDTGDAESIGSDQPFSKKPPHEHTEDLIGILKTGYPLLALSLENMIEHIIHRLRSSPEEDLYRIITTLITENIQQTMVKLNANLSDQSPSPIAVLETSLKKVADILGGSTYLSQKFKSSFENDFLRSELSLTDTLERLLKWRHQIGAVLEKLPNSFHLENFSRYLAEFEHQKYDDIDVPGQYLLLREVGSDFVKLEKFDSQVEIVRRHGTSFRRIIMIGNDGSRTSFIVQNPSSRQSRREERVVQLLRMADAIIDKKIVSKRHNLSLSVQNIVPLSAFVRLIQDNESFTSLEDIYEKHCRQVKILPEDPILYFRDCMLKGLEALQIPFKKGSVDLLNLRVDLFEEICQKFVPSSILNNYVKSSYKDFSSFWNFRRKFTSQYASMVFTTYILAIGHRLPHKIGFSRDSCSIVCSELLPALNQSGQFTLTEAVPFRLTPNIQKFLTDFGIEGPFTTFIAALGQALSGKKQDFADYLALFVRDEIIAWANTSQGAAVVSALPPDDIISMQSEIASKIFQNVEIIVKRVQTLGCSKEIEKSAESLQPLDQTILDLISCAANPQKLAHMDAHWHPCTKINQNKYIPFIILNYLGFNPMVRKLSDILKSCFKLELNFISEAEEIELIYEVAEKLKFMRWNEGHFDGKIKNYREYLLSDVSQFPRLHEITKNRVLGQMMGKQMLPTHILELRHDGVIMPHIDNTSYSGSIIAGLSIQRDSILTLSNSLETKDVLLPRRSFYRQIDDLRYNYDHSISFKGLKNDKQSRISLIFRDTPLNYNN